MKRITILFLIFVSLSSKAQVGVSGGASMFLPFGSKLYSGFNLGLEIPIDDESSYYGRLAFYSKNKGERLSGYYVAEAINPNVTTPQFVQLNSQVSMNYTTLELGRKAYFGGTYDYGFAGYGSSQIVLALNQAKANLSEFDRSLYKLSTGLAEKGSVFGMSIGLNGGVKYSLPVGTVFFDAGLGFVILGQGTNQLATDAYSQLGGSLFFSFNLGFRRDLY